MAIAIITISETKGLYTGRTQETIYVSVAGVRIAEVRYGANFGFFVDGCWYAFGTDSRGALTVKHPVTGKIVKLGKKGGRVDLETWEKVAWNCALARA